MISVKYWIKWLREESELRNLTPFERYHYKVYMMNYDDSTKEIGDKVNVWDTSFMCRGNGVLIDDEHLIKILPLNEGIVIETNCRFEFITNDEDLDNVDVLDKIYLDLLIHFPRLNMLIRTHSDFVKVIK